MTQSAGVHDKDSPDSDILRFAAARLRTLGIPGSPETDAPQVLDASTAYSAFHKEFIEPQESQLKQRLDIPNGSGLSAPRWAAYVGGCFVLAIVSWGVFQYRSNDTGSPSAAYTTYTTRAGQRASLKLRDGSQVTLGPATTLRVSRTQSIDLLEVSGEALFNVSHAAQHPFVVNAYGVTTRVLGTEFVVRAYDASLVRVSVRDGKVSVQSPTLTPVNAAIVTAGEAVSVTKNSVPTVVAISDMETEFAWANGALVLRSVPLGEAFERLSRWYGMEFRVDDPNLLERRINGIFTDNFSMAYMSSLAKVIKAQVSRSGDTLIFSNMRDL